MSNDKKLFSLIFNSRFWDGMDRTEPEQMYSTINKWSIRPNMSIAYTHRFVLVQCLNNLGFNGNLKSLKYETMDI